MFACIGGVHIIDCIQALLQVQMLWMQMQMHRRLLHTFA